jgi:hypothetical protein
VDNVAFGRVAIGQGIKHLAQDGRGTALIRAPTLCDLVKELVALDVLEDQDHVLGVLTHVQEAADAGVVKRAHNLGLSA